MGVATGCCCKEVYRFPHTTYPYSSCICLFYSSIPTFCSFKKKVFRSCSSTFLQLNLMYKINFSRGINTHTGNYGRPTAAI